VYTINTFYGPAKLSSTWVSKKAPAICACIIIKYWQSCDIAISIALCATYATRQHAGAKSARRDAPFPWNFTICRKKLARRKLASSLWIQMMGLWKTEGWPFDKHPRIQVLKSLNSCLASCLAQDNSCDSRIVCNLQANEKFEFEFLKEDPWKFLEEGNSARDQSRLLLEVLGHSAQWRNAHTRGFFFFFFLLHEHNSCRRNLRRGMPLDNESCAAYFDGIAFAIIRESGQQVQRETGPRGLPDYTALYSERINAIDKRTHAHIIIRNASSLSRQFYDDLSSNSLQFVLENTACHWQGAVKKNISWVRKIS